MINVSNMNNYKYVIPEAGSNTAKSMYCFLRDAGINKENIIAVDSDPKALIEWDLLLKVSNCIQSEFHLKEDYIIAPSDQLFRMQNKGDGILGMSDLNLSRNKGYIHRVLEKDTISRDYVPLMIDRYNQLVNGKKYISRPIYGKGSKGLRIFEYKEDYGIDANLFHDSIVNEYIDISEEYVIDFYIVDNETQFCPRVSHRLVNGNDTFVTILPDSQTGCLLGICEDIIKTINIDLYNKSGEIMKIGNIQMMKDHEDRYYFIEVTNAISASSAFDLKVGFNPIKGLIEGIKRPEINSEIHCSTFNYGEFND